MWIHTWQDIGRVLLAGAVVYVALVLVLRISGKRTLSKLNAFDLVVTVAIGSTLSSVLLSKDVAIAEGIAAIVVLVLSQFLIAKLSSRSSRFAKLVRANPSMLLRDGLVLEDALRGQRVTRGELLAAVRQAGFARFEDVGAVVLETDGSMSVLPRVEGSASAMEGVD